MSARMILENWGIIEKSIIEKSTPYFVNPRLLFEN